MDEFEDPAMVQVFIAIAERRMTVAMKILEDCDFGRSKVYETIKKLKHHGLLEAIDNKIDETGKTKSNFRELDKNGKLRGMMPKKVYGVNYRRFISLNLLVEETRKPLVKYRKQLHKIVIVGSKNKKVEDKLKQILGIRKNKYVHVGGGLITGEEKVWYELVDKLVSYAKKFLETMSKNPFWRSKKLVKRKIDSGLIGWGFEKERKYYENKTIYDLADEFMAYLSYQVRYNRSDKKLPSLFTEYSGFCYMSLARLEFYGSNDCEYSSERDNELKTLTQSMIRTRNSKDPYIKFGGFKL